MGNTQSLPPNSESSGYIEFNPSANEQEQGKVPLRLDFQSACCRRQHWFNNLTISFYPFEFTPEDLEIVWKGEKLVNDLERTSPNRKFWSWCPFVSVSITLGETSSKSHESVYNMTPIDATITAVWLKGKGQHDAITIRLPTNDFKFKQLPNDKISLHWEGQSGSISWKLVAESIISKEPEHGAVTWQKDSDTRVCWRCTGDFTFFNRRHHCRACGLVVCGACSKNTDAKGQRICRQCKERAWFSFMHARVPPTFCGLRAIYI